jgi:hypothetical protein
LSRCREILLEDNHVNRDGLRTHYDASDETLEVDARVDIDNKIDIGNTGEDCWKWTIYYLDLLCNCQARSQKGYAKEVRKI